VARSFPLSDRTVGIAPGRSGAHGASPVAPRSGEHEGQRYRPAGDPGCDQHPPAGHDPLLTACPSAVSPHPSGRTRP
jgi:hypothetical protein